VLHFENDSTNLLSCGGLYSDLGSASGNHSIVHLLLCRFTQYQKNVADQVIM